MIILDKCSGIASRQDLLLLCIEDFCNERLEVPKWGGSGGEQVCEVGVGHFNTPERAKYLPATEAKTSLIINLAYLYIKQLDREKICNALYYLCILHS